MRLFAGNHRFRTGPTKRLTPRIRVLLVASLCLVAGCGGGSSATPTPSPSPTPISGPTATNSILFSSTNDTGFIVSQVYSMGASGTPIIRLTTNTSDDAPNAWSPNGAQILFSSNRDNGGGLTPNRDLYVMAVDGTNVKRLTNDTTKNSVDGAWSPDGTKIAFSRAGQIMTMNADGSNIVAVSGSDLTNALNPTWSHDGTKIAFVADTPNTNVGAGHSETIYVMSPDGTHRIALTNGGEYIHQVAWSPDGTTLVFDSSLDVGGTSSLRTQVYTMSSADGRQRTRLTDNAAEDSAPVWSPDGTRILFSSNRDHGGGSGGTNAFDLYTMASDGSSVTRLTSTGFNAFVPPGGWKR